jgi:hypothetical protein
MPNCGDFGPCACGEGTKPILELAIGGTSKVRRALGSVDAGGLRTGVHSYFDSLSQRCLSISFAPRCSHLFINAYHQNLYINYIMSNPRAADAYAKKMRSSRADAKSKPR